MSSEQPRTVRPRFVRSAAAGLMMALAGLMMTLGLMLASGASLADGVRTDKWLTLGEVVAASPIILEVKVLLVAHRWEVRKAYREKHRYISEHRVKVKVALVIRGDEALKGKVVWLTQGPTAVPGKWMARDEDYASSYALAGSKKGHRFLAFLRSSSTHNMHGRKEYAHEAWVVEVTDVEGAVKKLLAPPPPPSAPPESSPGAGSPESSRSGGSPESRPAAHPGSGRGGT